MPLGSRRRMGGLVGVLLGGAAVLAFFHFRGAHVPGAAAILVGAQIMFIFWVVSRHWRWPVRMAGAACLAALLLRAPWLPQPWVAPGLAGLCHAIAYAGLLFWFASSLRRGRVPVVTNLASRVRPTMPSKVLRYTRKVTLAWCGFFAAQLVASALLLLLAPRTVWWMFISLANLPLVLAMALAELGCRMILFRHEPRGGLRDTLAAIQRARVRPSGRP